MTVNGYEIVPTPTSVIVLDSRGGRRYEIRRRAGAVRRACDFARMQRRG